MKIVDHGKESNDVTYLLKLILNVVTTVDNKGNNKITQRKQVNSRPGKGI